MFSRLCEAIPSLRDDPRFSTHTTRLANVEEVNEIVGDVDQVAPGEAFVQWLDESPGARVVGAVNQP